MKQASLAGPFPWDQMGRGKEICRVAYYVHGAATCRTTSREKSAHRPLRQCSGGLLSACGVISAFSFAKRWTRSRRAFHVRGITEAVLRFSCTEYPPTATMNEKGRLSDAPALVWVWAECDMKVHPLVDAVLSCSVLQPRLKRHNYSFCSQQPSSAYSLRAAELLPQQWL